MELVIVTSSQECSIFWDDFETPAFTVAVSSIVDNLISTVSVDCSDSSVIVADQNLLVQDINGGSKVWNCLVDLSDELELSSLG
jgi:hypothetical protein